MSDAVIVRLHVGSAALVRLLWASLVVLYLVWCVRYTGGFGVSPHSLGENQNDTTPLFNWHPLLMILAFPVLLTEAILTYIAAPLYLLPKPVRKIIHGVLQVAVMILVVLGLTAVFRSHSESKPASFDDMYSPHSYMGITTVTFFACQLIVGTIVFISPVLSEDAKKKYTQLHRFVGMATYVFACATIMAGIQEKNTFNQAFETHRFDRHKHFEAPFVIPAVMVLHVIVIATLVAFHSTFLRIGATKSTEEAPQPSSGAQEPLI